MTRATRRASSSGSVLVLVLLLLGVVATDARAQVPPPTLTGEDFFGTLTITDLRCNPNGTSSFSYQSMGVAVGPYPGLYSETGKVTLGPHNIVEPGSGTRFAEVKAWQARFSVASGVFQITGTKELARVEGLDLEFNTGICGTMPNPLFPAATEGTFLTVTTGHLRYEATITGPLGTFTDRGGSRRESAEAALTCPVPGGPGCSMAGVTDFRFTCAPALCPNPDEDEPPLAAVEISIFTEAFFSGLATPVAAATRPGKGCGDKNHVHARVSECKQ